MTIDEIIAHVAETPGWYLDEYLRIRRALGDDRGTACPVSSIDDEPTIRFRFVARRRRIPHVNVSLVARAADRSACANMRPIRIRLLQAARLSEIP